MFDIFAVTLLLCSCSLNSLSKSFLIDSAPESDRLSVTGSQRRTVGGLPTYAGATISSWVHKHTHTQVRMSVGDDLWTLSKCSRKNFFRGSSQQKASVPPPPPATMVCSSLQCALFIIQYVHEKEEDQTSIWPWGLGVGTVFEKSFTLDITYVYMYIMFLYCTEYSPYSELSKPCKRAYPS